MKYKRLMTSAAIVLLVSGLALSGWGPVLIRRYGAGAIPDKGAPPDLLRPAGRRSVGP
jgi:hypothetical protein